MRPQGVRLEWDQVASGVRDRVASALGSGVVLAENQPGGFSPGVAARGQLAGGRCYFMSQGIQPDPLGLPTLRAFQRSQGDVARAWLAQRLSWP